VIDEVEPGRDSQVFAFPIARARLDAIVLALGGDWRRGFAPPSAVDALVERWTPEFEAVTRDHTTRVQETDFSALRDELLARLASPRLRDMFRREIGIVRPPRDGSVDVPTGTLLASRSLLRRAFVSSALELVVEHYVSELAGEAHEEPKLDVHLVVPDHAWLVDDRPSTVERVRQLPAAQASRVRLLVHDEPADPSECVPWFVPMDAIDNLFRLGIGPYVPSLGGSPLAMARGARLDPPSWNATALTAVLEPDVGWRAYTGPAEIRRLALEPSFAASREALAAIAARGDAVVCRERYGG
jgi:hypothetical protein